MSATWAHVEAAGDGGASLESRVGGISLALRHARTAARVGYQGIRFVVEEPAEREALSAELERTPVPEGLALEILDRGQGEEHASVVNLEASAIYLRDTLAAAEPRSGAGPEPDYRIASDGERKSAERFLYAQIRKSIQLDGVIAFYIMRPLARVFTRILLNTKVSPNQATLGALACGIGAAVCAALGGAQLAIIAGLLYWFGGVLDCIDGELARLRLQSSKIGEWLDSMVDEFSTIALISGLGIGLMRDGYGDHWLLLGLGGAALAVCTLTPMYLDLHRKGLAIDTAQFPWFFGNENAASDEGPKTLVGSIINIAGYFIRRDANITGTSLLLILNYRIVSLSIILGAFVLTGVLVMTHYSVMAMRKSS